jgi:hypothetical protein
MTFETHGNKSLLCILIQFVREKDKNTKRKNLELAK